LLPFLDLKMHHSALRETTDCQWYTALEERLLTASLGTTLRATPPRKWLSVLFRPPAHKFPRQKRRPLVKPNISNTQCSSHTRKNTASPSFPDPLTHIPPHTWELTIIWWARLRGNMEGGRQSQCKSSVSYSQLEKTGEVLSWEKPKWQASTGPTQHCGTARNIL